MTPAVPPATLRPIAPVLIILAVLLFIALVIAAVVYTAKKERERREALALLAQRLGLSFDPADSGHWTQHQHFGAFNRGHSRRAFNTLRGTVDLDGPGRQLIVVAGDYLYKEEQGTGKDRRTVTYRFGYLIVRPTHFVFTQKLSFRPENVFDKIAGAIGFDDIDFESAEFSRKFLVKCDDKKFAYDLFDPRMIQWMLDTNVRHDLQSAMGEMALIRSGFWKPADLEAALTWMREFFSRWPAHVVKQLEQSSPRREE